MICLSKYFQPASRIEDSANFGEFFIDQSFIRHELEFHGGFEPLN